MEKKNQENILLKYKNILVATIVILLVLIGSFIIYINTQNSVSTQRIDPRANVYSGDNFEYEEETYYEYVPRHTTPRVTTKVIYIKEELSDKRHPLDDYKYGYTYRSSDDYRERHLKRVVEIDEYHDHNEYNHNNYHEDSVYHEDPVLGQSYNGAYYHYEYNAFTGEDEKKVCYKSAPADKLFYTKCPEY
jgi:hypothetical protein